MFDAELNSVSHESIFRESHYEIRKTLSQNTSEIRKISLVFTM